jgi:hypothetical protein
MRLLLLIYCVYAYSTKCNKCIYFKNIFPKHKYCIYYQEYLKEIDKNCSIYKLKDLNW